MYNVHCTFNHWMVADGSSKSEPLIKNQQHRQSMIDYPMDSIHLKFQALIRTNINGSVLFALDHQRMVIEDVQQTMCIGHCSSIQDHYSINMTFVSFFIFCLISINTLVYVYHHHIVYLGTSLSCSLMVVLGQNRTDLIGIFNTLQCVT